MLNDEQLRHQYDQGYAPFHTPDEDNPVASSCQKFEAVSIIFLFSFLKLTLFSFAKSAVSRLRRQFLAWLLLLENRQRHATSNETSSRFLGILMTKNEDRIDSLPHTLRALLSLHPPPLWQYDDRLEELQY